MIYRGVVKSIDSLHTDARGVIVPVIIVKSELDGGDIPIEWRPLGPQQYMPMVDDRVYYVSVNNYSTYIIGYEGKNGPHIHKGLFSLQPGEFCSQSDAGYGYLKGKADGSMEISSGDGSSSITAASEGMTIKTPEYLISVFSNCVIQLTRKGAINIIKFDESGSVSDQVSIGESGGISVSSTKDISIKGENIFLDGKVFSGPGASDPNSRSAFGDVVTSGPGGTHPFDYMTGSPIQGSSSMKAGK